MNARYPDSVDPRSPESGSEFEDFCMEALRSIGVFVQVYKSRRYQFERGESAQGVEIKLDRLCTQTQRLSVEIAEKTSASQRQWTSSGIFRKDNTWLYVQGNYDVIYVFAKTTLQRLHESRRFAEHETATVRAFYLPLADAEKYAAIVLKSAEGR